MSIDQLIHSTLKIEMGTTAQLGSSGTGFFYGFLRDGNRNVPAIVTNRHVVEGYDFAAFHITRSKPDGTPDLGNHERILVDNFQANCIIHPDPEVDLAIMPCGAFLNSLPARGYNAYFRMLTADLLPDRETLDEITALEEVIMIGYPTGLWDPTNNLPIVRRGSSATPIYIDYDGKKEFVVDMACFPGSSGSPVFIYNSQGYMTRSGSSIFGGSRILLVGILWGGPLHTVTGEIQVRDIPTAAVPVAVSRTMMNLGFCVKAERLLEFEPLLQARIAAG